MMHKHRHQTPWHSLALSSHLRIEIAIDTEYEDAETLSIQAACRVEDEKVAVKVYRAQIVPPYHRDDLRQHLTPSSSNHGCFCKKVVLRRPSIITPDLSPVTLLRDLFAESGLVALSRREVEPQLKRPESAIARVNGQQGHDEIQEK